MALGPIFGGFAPFSFSMRVALGTFDQEKLDQITNTLKAEFQPVRLFLFGSRANGTAKKNSDYDFVMVVSGNKKSSTEEMGRARSLIFKNHGVIADVFIYSEKEFDDWKDEFNSIPETALNTGKEILILKERL